MQEIKQDETDDVSGGAVRLPGQEDIPGLPTPFPGPGWPNPCPSPDFGDELR